MSKKKKKKEPKPQVLFGPSAPIKKVMPKVVYIPGEFSYVCEHCLIDWMLKTSEPTIKCPDCGQIVQRDTTFDEFRKLQTKPPEVVEQVA